MPFSTRVFCREPVVPSLSELLMWMRQFEAPLTIVGGPSGGDLLSSFWEEAELSYDADEAPLRLACFRADAAGIERLREEVADFVADVEELPASDGRARVLEQLGATRAVVITEFPPEGVSSRGD